ncbi:LppU/SCO3897 family protein [Streptomyces sp. NPDC054865]
MVIFLALVGGVGYWVYDYNTDPNGGQAKKEAAAVAQHEEDKTHAPGVGDCVKVQDPQGKPVPTIVDCGSVEAQYKTGEILPGQGMKCGPKFDYGIQHTASCGFDYTMCFTKLWPTGPGSGRRPLPWAYGRHHFCDGVTQLQVTPACSQSLPRARGLPHRSQSRRSPRACSSARRVDRDLLAVGGTPTGPCLLRDPMREGRQAPLECLSRGS